MNPSDLASIVTAIVVAALIGLAVVLVWQRFVQPELEESKRRTAEAKQLLDQVTQADEERERAARSAALVSLEVTPASDPQKQAAIPPPVSIHVQALGVALLKAAWLWLVLAFIFFVGILVTDSALAAIIGASSSVSMSLVSAVFGYCMRSSPGR